MPVCSNLKITSITKEDFGTDLPAQWLHVKPFGVNEPVQFLAVAPDSEVDSCIVMDTSSMGNMVLSVNTPIIMPIERDLVIRPFRTFQNQSGEMPKGRLTLLAYNQVPPQWSYLRAPRIYPTMQSAVLSSAADTSIYLNTFLDRDGTVRGRQTNLCVQGAKALTIYMKNDSLADVSWNLIHSPNGNDLYPISPSTWTLATPTYNTLLSGGATAYHLDVQADAIEHVYMVAKVSVAGSHKIRVGCEVRDR